MSSAASSPGPGGNSESTTVFLAVIFTPHAHHELGLLQPPRPNHHISLYAAFHSGIAIAKTWPSLPTRTLEWCWRATSSRRTMSASS